jgi:AraC-like DNA-binding protein
MFFKSYKPSAPLQHFIDEYVVIYSDENTNDPATDKFIPRMGEAMLFHFRDVSQILRNDVFLCLPRVFFIRQHINYEYIEPGQDSDVLIVRFKPGAIYRLFSISPLEFDLGFKDASLAYGDTVNALYNQLAEETDIGTRILCLETFFTEKLPSLISSVKTDVVSEAVDLIVKSKGCILVSGLASSLSVEERSLRRYFHFQVGIKVKSFIRLVKFNNIILELMKNPTTEMMDIVARFGYFDQTHFINDFKDIFGETPFTFLKRDKQNTQIISAIK